MISNTLALSAVVLLFTFCVYVVRKPEQRRYVHVPHRMHMQKEKQQSNVECGSRNGFTDCPPGMRCAPSGHCGVAYNTC